MDRFISSNEARLWTTQSGGGHAVLLFNGGPGCDDYLGPVAAMMDDLCRVIRFEPRGCGRSDWDGQYDLETLLGDAEAVRRAYGVDRWVVGGHSAGANVALAYAMQHPERTLGVFGLAGGCFVNDRDWSNAYHTALESHGEDLGGLTFRADARVNPAGTRSWRAFIKQPRVFGDLSRLSMPCVLINVGQDIRPNWPTRQLAELIPNATYVEIPDAGHYLVATSFFVIVHRDL